MKPIFGVDHDYPKPLLDAARPYLPFDVAPIFEIDRRLVDQLDDWQVLLALHQEGYAGLVTLDTNMLDSPREMAVLHQTNGTLVAVEAAGHNPLRAFGQLLVHATAIGSAYEADSPQLFRVPQPRAPRPMKAWNRLGELASASGLSITQLYDSAKLTSNELAKRVL